MMSSISEKINAIRQEPEQVRRRYVVICVSVTMVFVVGIWLLSVSESVTRTAEDLPQALEQSKKEMTSGVPSLSDMLEQSSPLRIEDKGVEGTQFFNQEMSERQPKVEEEPVPQPNAEPNAE